MTTSPQRLRLARRGAASGFVIFFVFGLLARPTLTFPLAALQAGRSSKGRFRRRQGQPACTSTQDYGAEQITVLEGLEPVRKRPGMYIGSTGARGLHHLVYEIVDNSVDEALAGHATSIQVELRADGSVRVQDEGRGIPCDLHAKTGRPALETVLTVLHAGGKFGGEESAGCRSN